MMRLNAAVARVVSAELKTADLTPKALTFWLGTSARKANALCEGSSIWTMPDLEEVAEGLGVDLADLLSQCAERLRPS